MGSGMERCAYRTAGVVDVGAQLKQNVDAAVPASRPVMKRCIAPGIGRGQVRSLGHQPSGQIIGTIVEGQRRLFAVPAAGVDFTDIKYGFEFSQSPLFQQRFEVLWKCLSSRLGHRSSVNIVGNLSGLLWI